MGRPNLGLLLEDNITMPLKRRVRIDKEESDRTEIYVRAAFYEPSLKLRQSPDEFFLFVLCELSAT